MQASLLEILAAVIVIYLVWALGVAGIAKLIQPGMIRPHNRTASLGPHTALAACEVVVALLLAAQPGSVPFSLATSGLFLGFISWRLGQALGVIKATECGCYGASVRLARDSTTLAASAAQACLAVVHVMLIDEADGSFVRAAGLLSGGCLCVLAVGATYRSWLGPRMSGEASLAGDAA
jgi:hypothetical protein